MDTFERKELCAMNTRDMTAYLRSLAMSRPDYEPKDSVVLTGRDVLAIAQRLASVC